jgi:biopolymer transport protein ExbD
VKLRAAQNPPQRHEENLIPMINVVFLLLIFFMLVGRLLPPEALPVEPPHSNSENLAEPEPLLLLAAADGRLALAGQTFPLEQLATQLTPYLTKQPPPLQTLKADATLPAQRLLDVLEALRAAGIDRLKLLSSSGAP